MGHSPLVGTTPAPQRPKGSDEEALGPSDLTDSGSDTVGADRLPTADPGEPVDVTLGRDRAIAPVEGRSETDDGDMGATDIGTDRVIEAPAGEESPVRDTGDSRAGPG